MLRKAILIFLLVSLCGCQNGSTGTAPASMPEGEAATSRNAAEEQNAAPSASVAESASEQEPFRVPFTIINETEDLTITEVYLKDFGDYYQAEPADKTGPVAAGAIGGGLWTLWQPGIVHVYFTVEGGGETRTGVLLSAARYSSATKPSEGGIFIHFTKVDGVYFASVRFEAEVDVENGWESEQCYRYDPRFDKWLTAAEGQQLFVMTFESGEELQKYFPESSWDLPWLPTAIFCYEPVYDLRIISVEADYSTHTIREISLAQTIPVLLPGQAIVRWFDHAYGLTGYIRYRNEQGAELIQSFRNNEVGEPIPYVTTEMIRSEIWDITQEVGE